MVNIFSSNEFLHCVQSCFNGVVIFELERQSGYYLQKVEECWHGEVVCPLGFGNDLAHRTKIEKILDFEDSVVIRGFEQTSNRSTCFLFILILCVGKIRSLTFTALIFDSE